MMVRRLALISLAFGISSPIHAAEPTTGTLVPGRTTSAMVQSSQAPSQQARASEEALLSRSPTFEKDLELGRAVALCVVEKKPIVAVNFLNAFTQKRIEKITRPYRAALSKCLGDIQEKMGAGTLQMSVSHYTNYSLLAEAYIRKHGVPLLEHVPLKDLMESQEYIEATPDYRLAACLAYTQPAAAKTLVASHIGSAEEKSAFSALAPLIPACVPAGSTLTLAKTWLRLRLATSLYLRAPPETPRSSTVGIREDF